MAATSFTRLAVFLAGVNDQSVIFIVESRVSGKALLEQPPNLLVGFLPACQIVPLQDPPCIGIHDKHGVITGVEQN
jgi:hypothetical protein